MEEISFSPVSSFLICFPFTKSYWRIVFFVEMKMWERTGWKTEVTASPPNLIENVWVDFWESLCIKIDFDWRKAKSRKCKEILNGFMQTKWVREHLWYSDNKKDICWHHSWKVVSSTMPFHWRHSLQDPTKQAINNFVDRPSIQSWLQLTNPCI